MRYYHFKNLFNRKQVAEIHTEIGPHLNNQIKPEAYDTEIDLTKESVAHELRKEIEQIVGIQVGQKLYSNNYWISISKKGEVVVPHNHVNQGANPLYSAVLYLQAEGDCGTLELKDYCAKLKPETGDLVIFPSTCYHSVNVNESETPRMCIAFDLISINI